MLGALDDTTRDQSLTCGKQGTPQQSTRPKRRHTHVLILKAVGGARFLKKSIVLSTRGSRDTIAQLESSFFWSSIVLEGSTFVYLCCNAAQQDLWQLAQGR